MSSGARPRAGAPAAAPGHRLLRGRHPGPGHRAAAAVLLRQGRGILPAERRLSPEDGALPRHRAHLRRADDAIHHVAACAGRRRRPAGCRRRRRRAAAHPPRADAVRADAADGRADGARHRPLTPAQRLRGAG